MSDGQGEQLAALELVSVAEVLAEHSRVTARAAFDLYWLGHLERRGSDLTRQGRHLESYRAGWRAALEWYIGLGTSRQLADALEEAHTIGLAEASNAGRPQ